MDLQSALRLGKKEETSEDVSLREERAREIHSESIVFDGHVGALYELVNSRRDPPHVESASQLDLESFVKGGVRCSVLSAFPGDRLYPIRGVRSGLQYADAFHSLGAIPGALLCLNAEDVELAKKEDRVGFMLGFEGGEFLEGSLEALRMFHRLGLRFLALTWSERNALADGAAESGTRGGLTTFGKSVLRECARLGIVVDVSHLSEAGFWDVADLTEEPFVASHSNCHAVYAHPRNLTDDQIKAVAESGGLVGISLNPEYISEPDAQPTLGLVCDHILHAIEVAGEDHVAIGSDFWSYSDPGPLSDPSEFPLLTAELLKRGLSGKTLAAVLGGNWLRVVRAVCG